jgi:hypothetical protein
MAKAKLHPDMEGFEEFKDRYINGDDQDIHELAKDLGYSGIDSLARAMKKLGVERIRKTEFISKELTELESKVLSIVRKRSSSVGEISRQIDRSSETVIKTLDSLRHKHYNVNLDNISRLVEIPVEPRKEFGPTDFDYYRHFYRFGIVADTQLGSKYQQLTLLHDAYNLFDDADVDFILHAGDLVDGIDMYRGHRQELHKHTAEEQREYVEEVYPRPKKEGLKTYIIGGNHDRSFYRDKGYDIVEHIAEHRDDFIYRGFFSAEFDVKGLPIRLDHPGGGIAYAMSYAPQKIVENMMGYINTIPSASKPVFLILGHWHKALHIPDYMGVDIITMPCFQAQTPFMQQHKNMMPTVGCAIAEVYLNEDNLLSSVDVKFIVMNDRIKEGDY